MAPVQHLGHRVKVIEGGLSSREDSGWAPRSQAWASPVLPHPAPLRAPGSVPAGLQLSPRPSGVGVFTAVLDSEPYEAPSFHKP